jgi:hypothetical protein
VFPGDPASGSHGVPAVTDRTKYTPAWYISCPLPANTAVGGGQSHLFELDSALEPMRHRRRHLLGIGLGLLGSGDTECRDALYLGDLAFDGGRVGEVGEPVGGVVGDGGQFGA